jgi:hypothetical protein
VPVNPVIGGARAPSSTIEMLDRSRPEYRNGYEFGRKFMSLLDPSSADSVRLWNSLVAVKTLDNACKLVGLTNPPDFGCPNQLALFRNFEAGCIAGSKST